MDTGEKVFAFYLILLVVVLFGGLIRSGIDSTNHAKQDCMNDAKALSVEYRYNGVCQFATEQGIWLDQHDYLMLAATSCK